jgi:hypothetical protein
MESIKEDINICYKHGAPNGAFSHSLYKTRIIWKSKKKKSR